MRFRIVAATIALHTFLGADAAGQSWMRDFVAADAAAQDRYGSAVAASVDTVVVGAPLADEGSSSTASGRVYVYRQTGNSWIEEARLIASDPVDHGEFGTAIGLHGDRLAVGAPGARINGVPLGAVYIFERSGSTWTQIARLGASDPLWGDEFGASLDLDGGGLVVGAPKKLGVANQTGAVYYFEPVPIWTQLAKLEASDAELLDQFGTSVALDAGRIVVGAPHEDDPIKESGAIYVFDGYSSAWIETAKLKPSDSQIHDKLGVSISLHNDTLVAGAPNGWWTGSASGSAVTYEWFGGAWIERGRLVPNDLGAGDQFGASVSVWGDELAVGAPYHNGFSPNAGAVWTFGRSGSGWLQLMTLGASAPVGHFSFGGSVDLSMTRLVVGSPHASSNFASAGSADLWSNSGVPLHSPFCFGHSCPCGNDDSDGGCYNSTGRGARLQATGSLSLSQDDLVITTSELPQMQFALLFMGPAQTTSQFGDGLRCADAGSPLGPGYSMLGPAQTSGSSGVASVGPGRFLSVPSISPGETRYLQTWYRDSSGPCSSAFNVSNAIAITFLP